MTTTPFPTSAAAVLVEMLRKQTAHLAGSVEGGHEEVVLERIAHAIAIYDELEVDSDDNQRWPAAHMVHDAAVLLADHLDGRAEYDIDHAALVAALNAFEAACL